MLYHVAVRGKLSLPDVWETREQAHASALEQFPEETSYELQSIRSPRLSDLVNEATLIGAITEASAQVLGDASWLDGENPQNAQNIRAEITGLVSQTLDEWAEFRKIELPGYIVVATEQVKLK